MADFRKWIMVFAAVALLLGMTTTASAQFPPLNCVANSGVPPLIRAEGLAELVGDVVIECTGGNPSEARLVNFDIFLNTNVTSDIISGTTTEGVLLVDEPGPTGLAPQVIGTNTFLGVRTSGFENRLTWNGVPFTPPGTPGLRRIFRITNVRANATQLPTGQFVPSSVSMFINTSPTGALPLSNPQQVVGTVLPSLSWSVTSRSYKQCVDTGLATVPVNVTELFATAFKKRIELGTATAKQDVPGFIYHTESGLTPTPLTLSLGDVGVADTGTRFLMRISGVPANVSLSVPLTVADVSGNLNNRLYLQLISGWDSNWAGGSDAASGSLAISGGATAALYEVRGVNLINDSAITNSFTIPITVAYSKNTVGLGTASISVNYAPINSTATMSAAAPEPRFLDSATNRTMFTIGPCRTIILWPFTTNQAGFDTGLAVSNTSRDPFGTPNQAGACTFYYYGNTAGGGAAPPSQTSTSIGAGEHLVASLSAGGNFGMAATPGFQGYVIAVCNFQFAHGYGFISDLGASKFAQGYLALIIPDRVSSGRNAQAFSLGQMENDGEQLVH